MKARLWLALWALSLSACEAPLPQARSASDEPSMVFEGFRARGTRQGEKQWEARAVRARIDQGRQKALAEQVSITYFQNGKAVSFAVAGQAEIDLSQYDLKASGGVRLRGLNGVVLISERLSWDNQSQMVSSDDKVSVLRGKSLLTGVGLRADRQLEKVEVLKDVQVSTASIEELRQMREQQVREPKR